MIPMDECEDRRVYRIRSRNLSVGAYRADTKGFIGIREKLGSTYLFEEYHHDHDPHVGTVSAMEPLDVWVPKEVLLAERLPGTWCGQHDRPCHFERDEGLRTGKWFHDDDHTELERGDYPYGKSNDALFDLLLPHHEREIGGAS